MFPEEVSADRLWLERCCRDTIDAVTAYQYYRRDETTEREMRNLPWEPHDTLKETRDRLVAFEEQWESGERATYVARPADDEEIEVDEEAASEGSGDESEDDYFLGTVGLDLDWERRKGDLLVWLRKPFWGNGYAIDAGMAMFDLAFHRLDLELVTIDYLKGNERARGAIEAYIESIGGQYDGVLRNRVPLGDEVRDLHRYSVSQAEYLEATEPDRVAAE